MDQTEQMDAAFKSTRVDPVSGNEVPEGAMPQEVRDDVPAMLSEGEYVIPANVLRYYGIRFFEELNKRAEMEMSGVKEQPQVEMEGEEPFPFAMEELEVMDEQPELPMEMPEGMYKGGLVKKYK
jgi:hypothetical protein